MNFLDHYNNELRQLRDAGTRFSKDHPQVAGELGLHPDAIADPFVERLLEGVAYLSARVQVRQDRECAEFAQQALARVCPLFMSATPAITTFAFHPDFRSPEAFRGQTVPRGSLIRAQLPGRTLPVTFATARDVTLSPIRLGVAECSRSLSSLPAHLAQNLSSSQAVLRLRFDLEGAVTMSDLALGEGSIQPLHLSLAGDLSRAYALHRAMLADTTAWFAVVPTSHGERVLTLPMSGIRLSGVGEEESLLPPDLGGLPGLRLLREYLAQPTRLLGVELDALREIVRAEPKARSFDLLLALRRVPVDLVGEVNAGQFRLFATPAINLYPRRIDPVPYDPNQTGQWAPVDRMRPTAHHLWTLNEVQVCDRNGRSQPARPILDTGAYEGSRGVVRYGINREAAAVADGTRRDPLDSHDLISLSIPGDAAGLEDITTIIGKGLVADRDWPPHALLDAELQLTEPAALGRVECLWRASAPRGIPGIEACWSAVTHIGLNPLAMHGPDRQDVSARVMDQLLLAADLEDALDRQRLASVRSVHLTPTFIASGRGTPVAWVRATHVEIDIAESLHADQGAWLFGRLLAQALSETVTLNEGVEIALHLDGERASSHSNVTCNEGALR
jgi:type VI secretion system protein ImpG